MDLNVNFLKINFGNHNIEYETAGRHHFKRCGRILPAHITPLFGSILPPVLAVREKFQGKEKMSSYSSEENGLFLNLLTQKFTKR